MAKLARLPRLDRAVRPEPAGGRAPRLRTRYYAFLSYSHKDKDLADWLHRELEKFRVPSSLAGKLTANGVVPRRLTPIFRDQHDLSAGDDLAVEIEAALAASQFLVVLCSPEAAKSRWTNLEIESFKRTRPEGCVLAAVVAGEPFASDLPGREDEECFPPALRYKYDRRGHRTSKRAEPLAADFRDGGDGRRVALLKLVAGMLGVGLDELVQREQTRRHRQLAYVAAASLAGMAVTSTLAVTAIQARDAARDQRREAEGLIGFMLGDLKDKLEPLGRLDVLDSIGARALAYYQKQDKASLSAESLAQRSKALTLLGEMADSRGELDNATRLYGEAFASTAELLRRSPDDPERLFDHAQNVFYVGQVAYERGDIAAAATRFNEYKQLADQMVALAPADRKYRLEQVYANTNLGTVLMQEHRYREAASTYQSLLGEAEALASAEPGNMVYARQLDQDLAWLADAYEDSGDLDRALVTRRRQLQLLSQLQPIDPRNNQLQRDAMTAHRAVGRLLASRGDIKGALPEVLKSVDLSRVLLKIEPGNTDWLSAAANSQFDLASVQLADAQVAPAVNSVNAGCATVERLLQTNSNARDWMAGQRLKCLLLRGRIALKQSRPEEALAVAQEATRMARSTEVALDRASLILVTASLESDALEAVGRRGDGIAVAREAIRTLPASMELRPSEIAEVAKLQGRIGNRAAAQQLISQLAAMGYRRPEIRSV
jgi:tetratricopeptide (TPR) repeat protein